jgi:anti-anti-sigma factor
MTARPLEASVRDRAGVVIVDLRGEINATAEAAFNRAYAEATSRSSGPILLNFREVDYINSTGIALIIGLLARARKSDRRLLSYGLTDHYVEIFRITRLADFMDIHPDEASALARAVTPS